MDSTDFSDSLEAVDFGTFQPATCPSPAERTRSSSKGLFATGYTARKAGRRDIPKPPAEAVAAKKQKVAIQDELPPGVNHAEKAMYNHDIASTLVDPEAVGFSELPDVCAPDIPGDITVTREGKMLRNFFRWQGTISRSFIDSYDQWVLEELRDQLASRPLRGTRDVNGILENIYTVFRDVVVVRPNYEDKDTGKTRTLYPTNALNLHITYHAKVYARAYMYNMRNEIIKNSPDYTFIVSIPVMVGSIICNIRDITDPYTLLKLGIDPYDPLGYFIINGSMKVLVNTDKLKLNKIFVFPPVASMAATESPVCRVTVPTPVGTKQMQLIMNRAGSVVLQLAAFRKMKDEKTQYTVNILHIVEFMDRFFIRDVNGNKGSLSRLSADISQQTHHRYRASGVIPAFKGIMKEFTPEKEWMGVSSEFAFTEAEYSVTRNNDVLSSLMSNIGVASLQEAHEKLREIFTEQFFPNINYTRMIDKVTMLAIMTVHLLRFRRGYRKPDNKDSWTVKKIDSAGKTIAQVMRRAWTKTMADTQERVKDISDLGSIVRNVNPDNANRHMEQAFTSVNYGAKGGFARQNITDPIEDHNLVSIMSHLTKVDVKMDRNSTSAGVRAVQNTQEMFICPAQTPDDAGCGIIKNLACTTMISIDIDPTPMIQLLFEKGVLVKDKRQGVTDYVLVNSAFQGWTIGSVFYEFCDNYRRQGIFHKHTEIVWNRNGWIEVYTDACRLIRPVLIVDQSTGLPAMDLRSDGESLEFQELLDLGLAGFIGTAESEFVNIAYTRDDLYDRLAAIERIKQEINEVDAKRAVTPELTQERKELDLLYNSLRVSLNREMLPYHYMDLHPIVQMGIAASMTPYLSLNNGCRISFQTKMFKQAMSIQKMNPAFHHGTEKVMLTPTTPIVKSSTEEAFGVHAKPYGSNVFMAILAWSGYNQEDGIIFNRASIQRGKFRFMKTIVCDTHILTADGSRQSLKKPIPGKGEDPARYKYICDNGLPAIGAVLRQGDCVIGKIQINANDDTPTNASIFMGIGQNGIVDDVRVVDDAKGRYVSVRLRQVCLPVIGNKVGPRYSQKATIVIKDEVDLPRTEDGIVPDVILNPHAIPSRMTIGMLMEMLTGTAAAFQGKAVDATGYQKYDRKTFRKVLTKYGYKANGTHTMYHPYSGEPMKAQVFAGMTYLPEFLHLAEDKIQARSRGQVSDITRQAHGGKMRYGAVRFGEMENRMMLAAGAANFLHGRMCKYADAYEAVYCINCKIFAGVGKYKYTCLNCRGNNFGKIIIPYVFKYLVQVMASVGVMIRSILQTDEQLVQSLQGMVDSGHFTDAARASENILVPTSVDVADRDPFFEMGEGDVTYDVDENGNIVQVAIDDEGEGGGYASDNEDMRSARNTQYTIGADGNEEEVDILNMYDEDGELDLSGVVSEGEDY